MRSRLAFILSSHIMIFYSGKVRQYRLIRAHVNFGTDSRFYPYDTQVPILKLRSLDYGNNEIILTTKILNNLNQVNPTKIEVNDITDLSLIQGGFCIAIYWVTGPFTAHRNDLCCDQFTVCCDQFRVRVASK